jgi:hypothetical protein
MAGGQQAGNTVSGRIHPGTVMDKQEISFFPISGRTRTGGSLAEIRQHLETNEEGEIYMEKVFKGVPPDNSTPLGAHLISAGATHAR